MQLLTIEQAAILINVTANYLLIAMEKNLLPFVLLPSVNHMRNMVRINSNDLEDFINKYYINKLESENNKKINIIKKDIKNAKSIRESRFYSEYKGPNPIEH